jgi:ParB-like chromosome segregation protein Spo0J
MVKKAKVSIPNEVVARKYVVLDDIQPTPELRDLLKPPSEDEMATIVGIAKAEGPDSLEPLTLDAADHRIIDGHFRYEAAKRAGLTSVLCTLRNFASDRERLIFMLRLNTIRRQLSNEEILELRERLTPGSRPQQGRKREHHLEGPPTEAEADRAVAEATGKKVTQIHALRHKKNRTASGMDTDVNWRVRRLCGILEWLSSLSAKEMARINETNRTRLLSDGQRFLKNLERLIGVATEGDPLG